MPAATAPSAEPMAAGTEPVAGVTESGAASSADRMSDKVAETASVAKDQAAGVVSEATSTGAAVAETAKEEARALAATATDQLKGILGQTRGELSSQVGTQQSRLADGMRSLSDDLAKMARGEQPAAGLAGDIAAQVGDRLGGMADWLSHRDPAAVLDEVTRYARRKPATFLAVAGIAGFLAGRVTRSLTDEARSEEGESTMTPVSADPVDTQYVGTSFADAPIDPLAPTVGPLGHRDGM